MVLTGKGTALVQLSNVRVEIKPGEDVQKKLDEAEAAEGAASPLLLQMREQVAEAQARLDRAKAAGDAKRIREAEQALAGKKQFLALAEGAA